MGSLGTGEILVIVLVAIIVFGPQRLPEISRKVGELLAKARQMANSVTQSIDSEYGDIAAPLKDLKGEYDATMSDMKGVAASAAANLSVEMPTADLKKQPRADRPAPGSDGPAPASEAPNPAGPVADSAALPNGAEGGAPDDEPDTDVPEDEAL